MVRVVPVFPPTGIVEKRKQLDHREVRPCIGGQAPAVFQHPSPVGNAVDAARVQQVLGEKHGQETSNIGPLDHAWHSHTLYAAVMILVLKLVLTPLLIAAATLAGRRWGPGVSGWFIGLPLTSAPVSLILALQNGPAFASASAVGVLGGQASVCVFSLVYALSAGKTRWPLSSLLALAGFFSAAFLWRIASLPLWPTFALSEGLIAVVAALMPRGEEAAGAPSAPAWDLPARMMIASGFVFGLTSAASTLGPQVSGLVSPFPVFGLVLAAFAHHGQGARAAARLLRGVVIGSFGFELFFLVVALLVTVLPVGWTYLLASIAAVAMNGISLRAVR